MERNCDNCEQEFCDKFSFRCQICINFSNWVPGKEAILQLIEEVESLQKQLAEANRKIEILIMS